MTIYIQRPAPFFIYFSVGMKRSANTKHCEHNEFNHNQLKGLIMNFEFYDLREIDNVFWKKVWQTALLVIHH